MLIWKMPSEDVSKLTFSVIDNLKSGYLLGYGFFIVTTGFWFFHSKYQRSLMTFEMKRVTDQRNLLQGKNIESSE